MQKFNSFEEIILNKKTVIALGNFDGVHIGHRKILADAVNEAKSKNLLSMCFTFYNHPKETSLMPSSKKNDFRRISDDGEKTELLREIGIDILVNVPFTSEIMHMKPEVFIESILRNKLKADTVCCGFNYRFGDRALGDVNLLRAVCKENGIGVHAHDPVKYEGKIVSSTAIRELMEIGDLEMCTKYLGRPLQVRGIVTEGKHIGTGIGVPTANFKLSDSIVIPPDGVYASVTEIDGERFSSITNIGINPTVGGKEKSIETNIFDFGKSIYGKEIRICLYKWIRKEIKFDSLDELKKQIDKDSITTKEYLLKNNII